MGCGWKRTKSPGGAKEKLELSRRILSSLAGLDSLFAPQPSDESLGYFRASLRDAESRHAKQVRVRRTSRSALAVHWDCNLSECRIRTCCGWRFAHSRAPGPRLCPQDQSQGDGIALESWMQRMQRLPACGRAAAGLRHSRVPYPRQQDPLYRFF